MVTLPPQTAIQINMSSLQTHPSFWGERSMTWDPHRWIVPGSAEDPISEGEGLLSDKSGCYIPWAIDTHVCPGKKYSQVELVAVLARLFGEYKVRPVPKDGEPVEEASLRLSKIALETQSKALLNEITYGRCGVAMDEEVVLVPRS